MTVLTDNNEIVIAEVLVENFYTLTKKHLSECGIIGEFVNV